MRLGLGFVAPLLVYFFPSEVACIQMWRCRWHSYLFSSISVTFCCSSSGCSSTPSPVTLCSSLRCSSILLSLRSHLISLSLLIGISFATPAPSLFRSHSRRRAYSSSRSVIGLSEVCLDIFFATPCFSCCVCVRSRARAPVCLWQCLPTPNLLQART